MDNKLKKYEKAILDILNAYTEIKYANVQVVTIGWDNNRFIHDCPMHFDIIDGKIWVQQNMTEWEVGEMLEEKGVPKSDIVAGFLSPDLRVYSKYAVA
jgi:hypothetical protein